jgi:hypothetical protein
MAADREVRPEPLALVGRHPIVDIATPLLSERGQPATWWRLDEKWEGYFPEDRDRMRWHAQWIANHDAAMDETD